MRTGSRTLLRRLSRLFVPIIDTILPLKERSARTKERSIRDLPLKPSTHTLLHTEITTLLPYHHRAVEDAIRALKYEGSFDAARLLAHALADYLQEEIAHLRAFSPRPILLIPVPLHKERFRDRGFNQIERICNVLPDHFTDGTFARVETVALQRIRATPQQARLSRHERLRNVRGAFLANKAKLKHTHVILIDDVCTTGATLAECSIALKKTGATVTIIALSRA